MAEGARLTASLATPQERLTQEIAQYTAMLKAGAISQTTFNRAVAAANTNYKTAISGAQSFGASIGKASGLLAAFGAPVSIIAAGFALKSATTAAIHFGDEIEKASAKTGIGAEELSELAYAAKQNDIELTGLTTALKKMQVTLSEIASSGKANDTLTALGVSIEQLRALKPEEQFELLADRIAALKTPADRTRAAVDLFGRAGADLLPLFEQGAAGIRALREEAGRMGATLTGEQARALAEADKAIKELKASFSGLARTLVAEVAPGLADFLRNVNAIVTGEAIGKLREQIDFLERMKGRSFVSVDYGEIGSGFFTAAEGAAKLLELQGKLLEMEQRRRALPPGGRERRPTVPGFEPEGPKDKGASEAERARKSIQDLLTTMQQQVQVTGETEEATIRYRIAQGDLADEFEKAGPTFDKYEQQLIDAAAALDQFKASEELDKANEQIAQQVVELQAARIAQTEGAAAAYAYLAAHGELAKTLEPRDRQPGGIQRGVEARAGRRRAARVRAGRDLDPGARHGDHRCDECNHRHRHCRGAGRGRGHPLPHRAR